MKKLLVLTAILALSACGCMNHEDEEEPVVTYQNVQARPQNCDYFDGQTCYRYVRRVHQAPAVRYREPRPVVAPAPVYDCQAKPSCGCKAKPSCGCHHTVAPAPVAALACGGCAPQISETREPVEVVYKKTTYTTVYEPKTSAAVSYEHAPYSAEQVEVVAPQPAPVAEQVTVPVQQYNAPVEIVVPANNNEEILLDVK